MIIFIRITANRKQHRSIIQFLRRIEDRGCVRRLRAGQHAAVRRALGARQADWTFAIDQSYLLSGDASSAGDADSSGAVSPSARAAAMAAVNGKANQQKAAAVGVFLRLADEDVMSDS